MIRRAASFILRATAIILVPGAGVAFLAYCAIKKIRKMGERA